MATTKKTAPAPKNKPKAPPHNGRGPAPSVAHLADAELPVVLTTIQVAQREGCSRSLILQMIKDGRLKARRWGGDWKIRREDYLAAIESFNQ